MTIHLDKINVSYNNLLRYYLLYATLISFYYIFVINILYYYLVSILLIPLVFFYAYRLTENILSIQIKIILCLIFFWNLITILRGIIFDFTIIGRMLTSPTLFYPMLIPMFAFVEINLKILKKIFRFIIILDILFIIYIFIIYYFVNKNFLELMNSYEFIAKTFIYPNTLLLLSFFYLNWKEKIIAVFSLFFPLLIAMFLARRGQIFYFSLSAILSLIFYLFNFHKKYVFLKIFLFLIVSIFSFQVIRFYNENFTNTFSLLSERINHDTRGRIEDCFYGEMNLKDFLFGKGIDGRYYCPGEDSDYENDTTKPENVGYRFGIETGYLDQILKGGFINLSLFTIINFLAIFRGLFSKNNILKIASLYLIINISNIWIENSQSITFRYILVWICIAICFSKKIKVYSNIELQYFFK